MIVTKRNHLLSINFNECQIKEFNYEYDLHLFSFDKNYRLFLVGMLDIQEIINGRQVDNNVLGIPSFIESPFQTAKASQYKSQVLIEPRWFQKLPIRNR